MGCCFEQVSTERGVGEDLLLIVCTMGVQSCRHKEKLLVQTASFQISSEQRVLLSVMAKL